VHVEGEQFEEKVQVALLVITVPDLRDLLCEFLRRKGGQPRQKPADHLALLLGGNLVI
jgi:hypothetical protein